MSNPKFKVGESIITQDGIRGHVVIILNPFQEERQYYCSMYPGAQPRYVYVHCIDLLNTYFNPEKKRFTTLQALNVYDESELKSTN